MTKKKFSILIPNYGYSPFIFECLDSAINQQTENLFDFEIIFCDQSTEETFNKINDLIIEKYGNNKINVIHSEIKGLLKARHTLMSLANGEYIQFIDSDDKIELDYLKKLYEIISKTNCDLIFLGWKQYRKKTQTFFFSEQMTNQEKEKFLDYLIFDNKFNSVWRKTFKKTLYCYDDYCYFETTNGEDKNFSIPIVKKAKKIIFHDEIHSYFYRENPNSMVRNVKMSDIYSTLFLLDNIEYDFKTVTYEQYSIFLNSFLVYLSSSIKITKTSYKEVKQLFSDSILFLKKFPKFKAKLKISNSLKLNLLNSKFYLILYILCKI